MKYVVTWGERSGGSAADYEQAQKRVLGLYQQWEMPEAVTFHPFLVRVGEFGGYASERTTSRSAQITRCRRAATNRSPQLAVPRPVSASA